MGEPQTITHEVRTVLDFPDRYRDLYDPERGVYLNYLRADIRSLMAAQNLEAPEVSEEDLREPIEAWLGAR